MKSMESLYQLCSNENIYNKVLPLLLDKLRTGVGESVIVKNKCHLVVTAAVTFSIVVYDCSLLIVMVINTHIPVLPQTWTMCLGNRNRIASRSGHTV